MPSYNYVSWQPDDEVTSTKLKQMADNAQTIYDKLITGDIKVSVGANNLQPTGNIVGTKQMSKIEGTYVPFDSQVPVSRYEISVPLNNIFTSTPWFVFTIRAARNTDYIGWVVQGPGLTSVKVQIMRRDGAATRFTGAINGIAVGY